MKRRTTGMGRIFKRRSRLTGKEMTTWWIAYSVDARERRESSHSTEYDAAKALLRRRLHDLTEGTYVGPERERVTVGELLDHLLVHYEVKGHRSFASARAQLKPLRVAFGTRRAIEITTGRILRLVQEWKLVGTTPATINRRLSLLRRAYRLGKQRVEADRLDFAELFLNEDSPRGRYLTVEAFNAIHANLPDHLKDFFEFAYLCGTRKQQLARTTWAHWSSEAREFTWDAAEVKAKRPHVLPLDGRPLDIIEARYQRRVLHCRYVFHGPRCAPGRSPSMHYGCLGDFKRAWATACRGAGYPVGRKRGGYVFHNTRHTAVTNLVNAGVPAHEAMAVSGHRTRSVFDRYSLSLKEQVRSALRRTTAIMQHQPTPTVVPLRREGR